ncbi:MAG: hypothetical protein UY50_C0012G0004 [Parcubacteria group bacterium GW2011_GWA2_49_9]|nr:MAG: hypothetical protein UY50_C0012G0004 [Parcubacteria group bacterium GW2011_GWA2_49_9]
MQIFEHINKRVAFGFGGVVLLLLGIFFYWLSGTGSKDPGPVSVLSESPLDATLGRELLSALAKLHSTKLDTTVFSDPVFASLKDFGVEIAAQPVGRHNPFAAFIGSATTERGGSGIIKPTLPSGTDTAKPSDTSVLQPPKAPANPGGFDVE